MKSETLINGGSNARVCIVVCAIPPTFSGAGLCAYRYACRFHKTGRLAFVIAERPEEDAALQERLYAEDNSLSGKVFRLPKRRFKKRHRAQRMARHKFAFLFQAVYLWLSVFCLLLLKRREYDVVYSFESGGQLVLYATLAAKLLGKKTILRISLLGTDDPMTLQEDRHHLRRWFRTKAFSTADGYISISPPITESCRQAGIPTNKVWEIPNSVDVCRYAPCGEEERRFLRNKLAIPDETFALAFVGGIIWRKGVDLLIEAFGRICQTCDNTQLFMIGPRITCGEDERQFLDRLDERIRLLGLTNRVTFIGTSNIVHAYMKVVDVFVFPSRAEGCANVLVEAMASGLPIVTCHMAGLAQYIIANEVDGLIVDYTPEAIAEAVERLHRAPDFRKSITANAVRTARSRFTTEIVDSYYDRVYMAMLKSDESAKPCNGEMNYT